MVLAPLVNALAPPICVACGAHAGKTDPLCGACRAELRWLGPDLVEDACVRVWAPLAYEGPARDVVRALKFHGARGAAAVMAVQIAANAPVGWFDGTTLVPVPLHPARARKRGYNQARLVAAAIAVRAGAEMRDCLTRSGPRGTQVGRDRAERLAGIAGGIGLAPSQPAPHRAMLVDDVVTTGATLAACARALREAGTREVAAVVYARTPGR